MFISILIILTVIFFVFLIYKNYYSQKLNGENNYNKVSNSKIRSNNKPLKRKNYIHSKNSNLKKNKETTPVIKKNQDLNFSDKLINKIFSEDEKEEFRILQSNESYLYAYDIKKNIYKIDKVNCKIIKRIKVNFPIYRFYVIKKIVFIETYTNQNEGRVYFFKIFDVDNLNFIKDFFEIQNSKINEYSSSNLYYIYKNKVYFPTEEVFDENSLCFKKTDEIKYDILEVEGKQLKVSYNKTFNEKLEFVNYTNNMKFREIIAGDIENKLKQKIELQNKKTDLYYEFEQTNQSTLIIDNCEFHFNEIINCKVFGDYLFIYSFQNKVIYKLDFNLDLVSKYDIKSISKRTKSERIIEFSHKIENYLYFNSNKCLKDRPGDIMFLIDKNFNIVFYIEYDNDKIRDILIEDNKLFISVSNRIEIYEI